MRSPAQLHKEDFIFREGLVKARPLTFVYL
jgi:hypothetical protein